MRQGLLNFICCPSCKEDLLLESVVNDGAETVSGYLVCSKCSKSFPVTKGIPRFVSDEELKSHTNKNFELYWKKLNWHKPSFSRKRFHELTGWSSEDIEGKTVIDAGCGGGRWLYHIAEDNAREIVAFDYTSSVDAAREVCKKFSSRIHYVQADIFNLPFKKSYFDIIHCHGVLMATPDPEKGLKNLGELVLPGGELSVLMYRNLTKFQKFLDDVICYPSRKMPTKMAYSFSLIPTVIEYIPGAVPLLENFIHVSGQPTFTLKHLHNFDWYTCTYRHRNSPEEVKEWLKEAGFNRIEILNTNEFRIQSKVRKIAKLKKNMLLRGFFLKATLGVHARKN